MSSIEDERFKRAQLATVARDYARERALATGKVVRVYWDGEKYFLQEDRQPRPRGKLVFTTSGGVDV